MTPEKSVRQIAAEMNEEARRKGMHLERDPWVLPALYEGSILDIPMTPEEEARIRRLDALIARLKREKAAAVTAEQQIADLQRQKQEREGVAVTSATNGVTQDAQSLPPQDRMPTP